MYQNTRKIGIPGMLYHKMLLIMRLTTVILIASLIQVSASSLAQKITLSKSNAPLKSVFKALKTQSGYNFFYTDNLLKNARPVNVAFDNLELEGALKAIFKDQPFDYEINNKTIVVKKKEAPSFLGILIDHFSAIDINGRVVDDKGFPLAGATILIKGTSKIVKSDDKGYFHIPGVNNNAILLITYVGYKFIEVPLKDAVMPLEIRLSMSSGALEEVGVTLNTGYQRIRPEQSTGAISVITTKDYESRISTNFLDGLVNKLPGLMINNDVKFNSSINGTTSSNSLFNIRGISTMTGNQNPLIVVDGYPTELSLNMIDPNEIKSVTILKDAAAATIYGVRASNGVIVIERKQADYGKPKIAFRATSGITPKENYSRYRWAPDASVIAVNYQRDISKSSVNSTSWNDLSTFAGQAARPAPYYIMAQQAAVPSLISPEKAEALFGELSGYNNSEDYSRLFLRTAASQTYNLNMSGGNDNALYYFTANYTDNALEQIHNGNNRFLLSGRTTLNFSSRFSLELTTDYQEERNHAAPVPSINSIYPYERFQDANGNPSAVTLGSIINPYYNSVIMNMGLEDNLYYPLVDLNEISDLQHTVNNRTTANFNYKIGRGFDLVFGGIYETSRTDLRHYATANSSEAKQYSSSYANRASDGSITYNVPKGGFLQQQTASITSYTARTQLNYNKHFSKHSINGILGGELRDVADRGNSAAYFGYNDQTLLQQTVNYTSINDGTVQQNIVNTRSLHYSSLFKQQYTDNRYISAYSNIVYAFRDTYSITGSIRIDQSNLFGTDPKYKYKPLWSVGAAWNIHKESFMKDVTWVNQLKLRIADGFNGNVAKTSLPQVIAKNLLNIYTYPYSDALQLSSYANGSLRWEQTHNFNVGLDYQLFRKINGSIDYYIKKSTDLLANAFIDPAIGVSPSLINSASIRNNGLELNLHSDWITTPRFNWNTGLVLAHNTSKVLNVYQDLLYSPDVLNSAGYLKNYPLGALFAYRSAGVNANGTPQVKDEQGNIYSAGITKNITGEAAGTIRYMGTYIPALNAGLSNRVDIGNFYFYCMINYYGGFKTAIPRPDPNVVRPLVGAGNYWKKPGDELNSDVPSLNSFSALNSARVYNNSDNYVVDGDYITLADLTASYNFNSGGFLRRLGLAHFELKAQGSNLWTIGLNRYNYSAATGSYVKSYLTPTYTLGLFTNF